MLNIETNKPLMMQTARLLFARTGGVHSSFSGVEPKTLYLLVVVIILVVVLASGTSGQSSNPCRDTGSSRFGSLMLATPVDSQKIPLILIHGINGTAADQDVTRLQDYWKVFLSKFSGPEGEQLRSLYTLYAFQYCSNIRSVRDISETFRMEVERKLRGRRHVILAHSMGGLVAKSYMADTTQNIDGRLVQSGEAVLGLITLATPHRGTPGANSVEALNPLITPISIAGVQFPNPVTKRQLRLLNFIYWNRQQFESIIPSIKRSCLSISLGNPTEQRACVVQGLLSSDILSISESSTRFNRADLRWDNNDVVLEADTNDWLLELNSRFKTFSPKTIVYAGALKPQPPDILSIMDLGGVLDDSARLMFADGMLHFGLNKRFGYTDGLVPYKSAMFCDYDPSATAELSCSSRFRVRRFEFGDPRTSVDDSKGNTLSITRTIGGFDHREMFEHGFILKKVQEDLIGFVSPRGPSTQSQVEVPPPAAVSVPTLFLMDVSGSMAENDKIGQARSAGIAAISEMQRNRRSSQDASTVSISVFGGPCEASSLSQLLPYTTNLDQAAVTLRNRLPRPDGQTPLFLSIDQSVGHMQHMLATSGSREGRIIVLSDGEDTCPETIRPKGIFSTGIQRIYGSVQFMTIGFDVPAGSPAERDLQYLSSVSGGQYFPASDPYQLSRAFAKTIRVYVPKYRSSATVEFQRGVNALTERNFAAALQIWTLYVTTNPDDPLGNYNLALAFEASRLYRGASSSYQKYLQIVPNAVDKSAIEEKIGEMRQEYIDQLDYYNRLIESDIRYLESYYQSLFNRTSSDLSLEFSGFVNEKRNFYANLPSILEYNGRWLVNDSKDLSSSISVLARRVRMDSFDRDAVSLLTLPIAQMKDLVNRLRERRTEFLNQ